MQDFPIMVTTEDTNTNVFGPMEPYKWLSALGVYKPVTEKPLESLDKGETTKGTIDVQGFRDGRVILFKRHSYR